MRKLTTAALAAFLVIAPASTPAMAAADTDTTTQRDEDDGFPWGLLGLLGLAGLMGLKKDDRDHHHTTNRTDGRL